MNKILVVDDEGAIASMIADMVGLLGCESRILNDGKDVLSVAKEWKPDLITLDIMMPPPDGIEVLSQLKNDPETKTIPVVIISVVAKNREFSSQIALADKVVAKPMDLKKLGQTIRKLIGEL